MVDFYHQGSTVGVAISGWFGVFITTFILFEIIQIFVTKSPFTQKLIIHLYLKRQLMETIPPWWEIKRVELLTISKYEGAFNCYVQVRPKYGSDIESSTLTDNFVTTNWRGMIIKTDLLSRIEMHDKLYGSKLKEWKRNWNLERLIS